MRNIDVIVSETTGLAFDITLDGIGITGQTPTITIKKVSAGTYWNGSIWTTINSPSMAEYDSTNFPGLYTYSLALPATADSYLVIFTNTGTYAGNDYAIIVARPKAINEVAPTRTATSPASSTIAEKIEEIHGAIAGKMQLNNSGTGSCIKASIYNYAEASVIKEMDIVKPAGTVNTETLDTKAMAGRKTSV